MGIASLRSCRRQAGSTLDIRRLEEPSDASGTPNVQRPMSNFEVTPTGDEMQTMKFIHTGDEMQTIGVQVG
jgi:hypothetical protein